MIISVIGFKDDTVSVRPKYGRNCLIPLHGHDIFATKSNKNTISGNISSLSTVKTEATSIESIQLTIATITG
ncbi:hypothetical protein [Fulvitalea axinellae]|uniref:hypothetical protein n=1 Tax=Fulvitalea axinellae TaxID=1182444 RepID=UPI003BA94D64